MIDEAGRAGDDPIDRRIFYPMLIVGVGCVAYGVRALVERNVPLPDFATWFIGALVLHDLVLVPAVVVAGRLVSQRLAEPWRRAVQVGTLVGGAALLFTLPALVGDGSDPRDPSRLPNDYGRTIVLVLGVIAAVVLVQAAVTRRRGRAAPRQPEP